MVDLQTHIASMGLVGIFDLLIYQKNQLDAGKYTVGPMDPMGNRIYKHNMKHVACMQACLLTHLPSLKMNAHPPTKPFFRPSKISFLLLPRNSPIHHVPLPMSPHIAGPEIWRSLTDDRHGIETWEICLEVGCTFSSAANRQGHKVTQPFSIWRVVTQSFAHDDIHRPVLFIKVEQAKQKYKPIYVELPNTKRWFTVDSVKVISHFLIHLSFLTFTWICLRCLGKSKTYSLKWIQMVVQY